jgi:plasmid stabilization system protein ParE
LVLIWRYIAEDSLDAADDVEAAIYRAFDSLSSTPNAGHRRKDLTDRSLRFWSANPDKNYLVVYDAEKCPVRIIRILHAALDAKAILAR